MRLQYWTALLWLQQTTAQWAKPDSNLPSFSDTYTTGETIYFAWLKLNASTNDLWLTRYDTTVDNFAVRIQSTQDISKPNSTPWTLSVDEATIGADTRFVLRFVPIDVKFDSAADQTYITSPAFNIRSQRPGAPVNGTVTASPSSTINSTSSTTTTSSAVSSSTGDGDRMLNAAEEPGVKIGIGIGAVGAVSICLVALLSFLFVRRRRRNHKKQLESGDNLDGPYEVLGDKRPAMELMSSKETAINELNGGKESSISEAGSSIVYEIDSAKKKPGLHELPG